MNYWNGSILEDFDEDDFDDEDEQECKF